MFRNYKLKNLNLRLIIAVVALTIVGILVIGSANADYQSKQIIGLVLGLIVMSVMALIDFEFLLQFYYVYYGAACLALLLVFTPLGDSAGGATRWVNLGIRFQPSEMAKILLVLFFSQFLLRFEDNLNTYKSLGIVALTAGIPLLLIVKEPDLSTTIVTFLILSALIFSMGLSYKLIGIILGITVPAIGILLILVMQEGQTILDEYQGLRILAWLKPDEYPESSYQQTNSIMAIGSGQLLGKGLNNDALDSVKNGNYISEPQTDFIFAVAGEELGFIGSVIIVILLLVIVIECLRVAKKAKTKAGELLCIGIASLIGFQSFVNICVVTGLMPNTGLPLPFVSYGLTSLVTLYFGIGIVLNVGLQAKKY